MQVRLLLLNNGSFLDSSAAGALLTACPRATVMGTASALERLAQADDEAAQMLGDEAPSSVKIATERTAVIADGDCLWLGDTGTDESKLRVRYQ
jgi:hypothetical protein